MWLDIYSRDRDQCINFLVDQPFMCLKAFFSLWISFLQSNPVSLAYLPGYTCIYIFWGIPSPSIRKIFRWSLTLARGAELREGSCLTGHISTCVVHSDVWGFVCNSMTLCDDPSHPLGLWGCPAAQAVPACPRDTGESCAAIPSKLHLWGFQSLSPICHSSNLQAEQHLPELQQAYY